MYEDSIQELNNLIGELDLFQREHEQKMKQKQREKTKEKPPNLVSNGCDMHSTMATDTSMMTSSIVGENTSDIYSSFEHSPMGSMYRTAATTADAVNNTTNSDEVMYGSDAVDGFNDLTDCQATTMSLKLNLSTTEYPLIMEKSNNNNISSSNCSNTSNYYNGIKDTSITSPSSSIAMDEPKSIASCIELIPDSYNVSDDYVKEYSEIVVLRRKDSQNDISSAVGCHERSSTLPVNMCVAPDVDANDVERTSSFRCSSFAKTNSNATNDTSSAIKRGQSFGSADLQTLTNATNRFEINENINETPVMNQFDQGHVDHVVSNDNDCAESQTIRQKPVITPRPASLSGSFFVSFNLFIPFHFFLC